MDLAVGVVAGFFVGIVMAGVFVWLVRSRLRAVEAGVEAADRRVADAVGHLHQALATVGTGQQQALASVSRQLGEVAVTAKQLAVQTQRLDEIRDALRVPGPRGGMGELLLENVLRDVLPDDTYATQHEFSNGSRVDAVVRFGNLLIPIDAKFPLTAFNAMVGAETDAERADARKSFVQSVRRHIDAVHAYVRPDDGTAAFALLYIPGESVFYEALRRDRSERANAPLWQYAHERRVTLVSPNSLYVYLQTIAMALQGQAIERSAQHVQDRLARLTREIARVLEDCSVLGTHLRNARGKYEDVEHGLVRIQEELRDRPSSVSNGERR